MHGRLLNSQDALELDTMDYRGGEPDWRAEKSNDNSKEGWYHGSQIFYWKWKDTWKEQPSYYGWLTRWSKDFVDNPPSPQKCQTSFNIIILKKTWIWLTRIMLAGERVTCGLMEINAAISINIPLKPRRDLENDQANSI